MPQFETKRKYQRLQSWQQDVLRNHFGTGDYWPIRETRERLSRRLGLPQRKVQVWFQNMRAKKSISIRSTAECKPKMSSLYPPPKFLHEGVDSSLPETTAIPVAVKTQASPLNIKIANAPTSAFTVPILMSPNSAFSKYRQAKCKKQLSSDESMDTD